MTDLPLSRRTFVGASGVAGSFAAWHAGTATPAWARPARESLRVGVILPTGLSHAGAGENLLAGLRLGFAASDQPVTLRIAQAAQGYAGAATAAAGLAAAGVQLVVAGVSTPAAVRVTEVCREAGVGLVVASSGAHVVGRGQGAPTALHTSLQHWQSSFTLGKWAAGRLGRRLFLIVAAPDAGFDSVYALSRGFTGRGGTVVGRALTHDGGPGVAAAARAARDSGAGVVAIHASGARAREIARACRTAGVTARLLVDPLALEPFSPGRQELARLGAWTATPWPADSDRRAAVELRQAWRRRHQGRPDAFAALGYDTGLLAADGARRVLRGDGDFATLARRMRGATVPGARGAQRVDQHTGTVSSPLSVVRVRRAPQGSGAGVRTTVVAKPGRVPGDAPAMVVMGRGDNAAYVNEYLGT